ncbi:BACON domain-containing protein [Saccharicrinis fermentans]|uniref:BACON domain-containing protein n=1 Tax=Saccharicrinis fermentans DSM 9555 = JCM 21142 TaxID=869213 RepID=W7YF62_9BACT|nr:BACON domain-containing protein [Saccharicrinis fermentans]GAF03076.1 hypothetical protein JCM21142_41734 [Saccharicrinis fermentans DSM 9555 = JCM 21142]
MKTLLIRIVKLTFFLFCISFFSCSKDSDPGITIEVNQSTLIFQPGAETKSFEITASEEWNITSAELSHSYGGNFAETNWFRISPVYGVGNATITITTKEDSKNNNIELHIEYGNQAKTITLIQN